MITGLLDMYEEEVDLQGLCKELKKILRPQMEARKCVVFQAKHPNEHCS
jgi:hypothetical protein